MWRKILIVAAVICLLTGIGFLLFAPISNFFGQKQADSFIEDFDKAKENITETITTEDGVTISSIKEAKEKGYVDEEGYPVTTVTTTSGGGISYGDRIVYKLDLDRLKEDSLAYNEMLLNHQFTADTTDFSKAALDLREYGIDDRIYCYITINAIGMRLPVYLGANDTMMSYGAAHLYGTSLPVGEMDTTCAFAGHTDYIGRVFFDNIRKLEVGNEVTITTWWEKTDYSVIDYKIVKPDESADLQIQENRQLLTLITCIPDGEGDFDRYLVICEKDGE